MTFLNEDLPLRNTSDIGTFTDKEVMPIVYGDMSKSLVPLARLSNTEFVLDGAVERITAVWVDDSKTTAYAVSTQFFSDGKPYTKIELSRSVGQNSKVSASLFGKVSPINGLLLENPADIMNDILSVASISNLPFDYLREECASNGIRIAGAITHMASVQSHLDEVAKSCGAIWSTDKARLYPSTPVGRRTELDIFNINTIEPITSSEGYASAVKLNYDYNYTKEQSSRSLVLRASPYEYDSIIEIDLPMVRVASIAESIGRRLLLRFTSPKFQLKLNTHVRSIKTLDWVKLNHPELPLEVLGVEYLDAMVVSTDKSLDSPTNDIFAEAVIPHQAIISVVSSSQEQRLSENASVEYQYVEANQQLIVTVKNANGSPLENAKVSINNGQVYVTNKKGIANLPVTKGVSTLYVQFVGVLAFSLEIYL